MVDFSDFGKMMVRSPMFPYSLLFDGSGTTVNLDQLTDRFLEDERFLEGIYWSSIPLYHLIIAYKQGKDFDDKKRKKLLYSLQKYIIRSCSRATPFGTFAGVNLIDLQATSSPEPVSKRHLRIDTTALIKIVRSIEDNSVLAEHLNFHVNNTLYTVANQFRFLEVDKPDGINIRISSLEKTRILKKIVSIYKKEKFSFPTLYEPFSDAFEREEFYAFFQELVTMGFLVSELEMALTAENTLESVVKFMSKDEVQKTTDSIKYKKLLANIQTSILKIGDSPVGEFISEEGFLLKKSFEDVGINIKDEQIFHVDLFHATEEVAWLTPQELKNIEEAIHLIGKVTTGDSRVNADLEKFKSHFTEKYETRPMPLLEVLDVDIGIGFPANERIGYNVKDFPIRDDKSVITEPHHNLTDWLIDKIEETTSTHENIEIKSSELQNVTGRSQLLPNTFCVAGEILGNGKIVLQNVGGASATSLLSRFAYMEFKIDKLCNDIADDEKNISRNAILADIVWVPTYKTGNISRRISHYDYEIPIYYPASFEEKRKIILLEDIIVSVEQNEIILTSKKLKTRIIPVLSNAHNFLSSRNPIYQFLCSLQYQHSPGLGLKYDFIKSKKRFFPGIFYKNIILFPAHWILRKGDIERILPANQKKGLKEFFKKWKVAQYVTLGPVNK